MGSIVARFSGGKEEGGKPLMGEKLYFSKWSGHHFITTTEEAWQALLKDYKLTEVYRDDEHNLKIAIRKRNGVTDVFYNQGAEGDLYITNNGGHTFSTVGEL